MQEKVDQIWKEIFALQREACKGELCLPDKLRFNDLKQQLEQFLSKGVTADMAIQDLSD